MSVPREVLKWVLGLDLSYPVKNVRRDFANGFLFAEILSRYYPADIQMHSFENVASMQRKKQNWSLLEKFFKRKRMSVERQQMESIMNADGDTAVEVLQMLYSFINSPNYEATRAPEAQSTPSRVAELALPRHGSTDGYDGGYYGSYEEAGSRGGTYGGGQYGGVGGRQYGGGYGGPVPGQGQAPLFIPMGQQQQQHSGHNHAYSRPQQRQQEDPIMASPLQQPGAYAGYGGPGYGVSPLQQSGYAAGGVQGGGYVYAPQGYGYAAQAGGAGGGGSSAQPAGYGARQAPPAAAARFTSPARAAGAGVGAAGAGRTAAGAGAGGGKGGNGARSNSAQGSDSGYSYAASAQSQLSQQQPGAPAMYGYGGGAMTQMGMMDGYAAALQQQQQQAVAGMMYGAPVGAYGAQYMAAAGQYGGAVGQYGQYGDGAGAGAGSGYAAAAGGGAGGAAGAGRVSPGRGGPTGAEGADIPFSKQRPVDYQPYDMRDYEDKAYNVKRQGAGYWQLGRLGPDLETTELQAKREKADKLKQLAAAVREENMRKTAIAAGKPKAEKAKEPTARDKALQFAKGIPKPEPMTSPSPGAAGNNGDVVGRGRAAPGKAGAGPAAGAVARAGARARGGAGGRGEVGSAGGESNAELAAMEAQHAQDQKRVEQIRAELARMM